MLYFTGDTAMEALKYPEDNLEAAVAHARDENTNVWYVRVMLDPSNLRFHSDGPERGD
jgi:hypothetical protein